LVATYIIWGRYCMR